MRFLAEWLWTDALLWDLRRWAGLHRRGRLLHPGHLRQPGQELWRLAGYLWRQDAELWNLQRGHSELCQRNLRHLC